MGENVKLNTGTYGSASFQIFQAATKTQISTIFLKKKGFLV